jgi:hypothetical protein
MATLLRKSVEDGFPLSQTDLSQGFRDRNTKSGVAVQDRDAHLNLCDLSVKVACRKRRPRSRC